MNKEEFINYLKELGIDITEEQLEQLDKYYKMLIEWNEKINLTRIIEQKEVRYTIKIADDVIKFEK